LQIIYKARVYNIYALGYSPESAGAAWVRPAGYRVVVHSGFNSLIIHL